MTGNYDPKYNRSFRIDGDTLMHGLPVGRTYAGYINSLGEIYLVTSGRDTQVDPACVTDVTEEQSLDSYDCDACGAVCTCQPTEADLLVTLENAIELVVTSRDFEDAEILSLQWLLSKVPFLYEALEPTIFDEHEYERKQLINVSAIMNVYDIWVVCVHPTRARTTFHQAFRDRKDAAIYANQLINFDGWKATQVSIQPVTFRSKK